jgi:phage tail-like protein
MALGRDDISPANAFRISIDGIDVPAVIEVLGLKAEVDKIELKQQTEDGKFVVRQLIGRPKSGELTITRGLTGSSTVTDWFRTVMAGDVSGARKTVAVAILDREGGPVETFTFVNCWVKSVEVSPIRADATESATERFVICYDESSIT